MSEAVGGQGLPPITPELREYWLRRIQYPEPTPTSTSPDDATPDWRAYGNCVDADPDLFLPAWTDDSVTIKAAKAICKECAVKEECLEYGLSVNEPEIFGEKTERERRRIRKERALDRAATTPEP